MKKKLILPALIVGIAQNMSSEALLETFLNYPFEIDLMAYSFPSQGVAVLKEAHKCGLDELSQREDYAKVVYEYYRDIKVFDGEYDENMPYEDRVARYPQENEEVLTMYYLEILALDMNLERDNLTKYEKLLRKEIDRKMEQKQASAFYGNPYSYYHHGLEWESHNPKNK